MDLFYLYKKENEDICFQFVIFLPKKSVLNQGN